MWNTESIRVEGSGQTIDYIEHATLIVKRERHTLRVLIHDDSYPEQAWGRVERWTGKEWKPVVNVRGDALLLEHGVGYRVPGPTKSSAPENDKLRAAPFSADRNHLVKLVEEVL